MDCLPFFDRLRKQLCLVLRVLLGALLLLLGIYAVLLFAIGTDTKRQLRDAEQTLTPVLVQVTQYSRANDSLFWFAVVLEDSGKPLTGEMQVTPPLRFGTIYATTLNHRLKVGQMLTGYFNEESGTVQQVDFQIADDMRRAGGIGFVVSASHLLLVLRFFRRRRKQRVRETDAF